MTRPHPQFNRRELKRLRAALNDAISDRETFVQCHHHWGEPVREYAGIIARSKKMINSYEKLRVKIESML